MIDHLSTKNRLKLSLLLSPYQKNIVLTWNDLGEQPLEISPAITSSNQRKYKLAINSSFSSVLTCNTDDGGQNTGGHHRDLPEGFEQDLLACFRQYRLAERQTNNPHEFITQTKQYSNLKEALKSLPNKEEWATEELSKYEFNKLLNKIWSDLIQEYFPDHESLLNEYKLLVTQRIQTQTLASCNVERKRIEVAGALNHSSARSILSPLIYHEMCHAVLGPPKEVNGRCIFHGKEFKALERRNPQIALLNNWIKEGHWEKVTERFKSKAI